MATLPVNPRHLAPLSCDYPATRWALLKPHLIATTCSPGHVEGVLVDALDSLQQALECIRALETQLASMDFHDMRTYSEEQRAQMLQQLRMTHCEIVTGRPAPMTSKEVRRG